MRWHALLLAAALLCVAVPGAPQVSTDLEGFWSTPPLTPEDYFCASYCTDAGLERLRTLLADPANDTRPYSELTAEASAHQRDNYIRPLMTPAALMTFPLALLNDPGFVRCEPWGVARQVFSQLGVQIQKLGNDRVEMRYGEWNARRTVYLDGRRAPGGRQTRMGYSVGRYEGDTFVVETTGMTRNWTYWSAEHSDQLRITERYIRSGDRLLLTATFEDPWSLRAALVLKKVWSWSPNTKILPVDCERPAENLKKAITP